MPIHAQRKQFQDLFEGKTQKFRALNEANPFDHFFRILSITRGAAWWFFQQALAFVEPNRAVLPFARVGIMGGVILALGRALGETMAVTMVIGNQASPPSLHLFNTGYTLSSVIANQFGEATPGLFISALLEAGFLLLIITLVTNILARVLIARMGGGKRVGGFAA